MSQSLIYALHMHYKAYDKDANKCLSRLSDATNHEINYGLYNRMESNHPELKPLYACGRPLHGEAMFTRSCTYRHISYPKCFHCWKGWKSKMDHVNIRWGSVCVCNVYRTMF